MATEREAMMLAVEAKLKSAPLPTQAESDLCDAAWAIYRKNTAPLPLYADEAYRAGWFGGAALRQAMGADTDSVNSGLALTEGEPGGAPDPFADAEQWGNALNEASWALIDIYRAHMGQTESGRFFNSAKSCWCGEELLHGACPFGHSPSVDGVKVPDKMPFPDPTGRLTGWATDEHGNILADGVTGSEPKGSESLPPPNTSQGDSYK
jgi:hypothetical protein